MSILISLGVTLSALFLAIVVIDLSFMLAEGLMGTALASAVSKPWCKALRFLWADICDLHIGTD